MIISTREAILQEILTRPADDLPRLVYADWLDENGEHERAEFVRFQIELAKIGGVDPHFTSERAKARKVFGDNWEAEVDRLLRRERELWPAVRESIRPSLGELFPGQWCVHIESAGNIVGGILAAIVRRGFISEITVPTLAALLGGECGRCEEHRGRAFQLSTWPCTSCSGTGRTPDRLAAVFAAHPVTRVEVTGAVPNRFGERGSPGPGGFRGEDTHYWITTARPGTAANWLPAELRPYLGGLVRDCGPAPNHDAIGHYFPTREAATAAFSAAIVSLGRSRAGLRPFNPAEV